MTFFLSLLSSKWTWVAVAALGVGLYVSALKVEVRHEQGKNAALEKSIGELQAGVATRDAEIAKQNRAVEGWKAAGIQNALRARGAEDEAKRLLDRSKPVVESILSAQIAPVQEVVSQTVAQQCEGDISWLRTEARSLSVSW